MALDSDFHSPQELQKTGEYVQQLGASPSSIETKTAITAVKGLLEAFAQTQVGQTKLVDSADPTLAMLQVPKAVAAPDGKGPLPDAFAHTLGTKEASLVVDGSNVNERKESIHLSEVLERLQARRVQIDTLLSLASTAKNDEEKLVQLRLAVAACPQFTAEECIAVINNPELVKTNLGLRDAIIVGGRKLNDAAGRSASLYTMSITIGEGGMGKVKDGFLLKEGRLIAAAIKEPKTLAIDPSGDQIQQRANQEYYRDVYALEAQNATNHLQEPIQNVMQTAFVSEPQPDTGLPIIAYEKIVDKNGKTTDFAKIADNKELAPSLKFAAFSHAIDGLAALHQRGLVHWDFKPNNTVLNANGEGVVIDPGSMFSQTDSVLLFQSPDTGSHMAYKSINIGGEQKVLALPYTQHYMDLNKVAEAHKQGKPLSIADRYAVGQSLADILASSNLTPSRFGDEPRLKVALGLGDADYPPPSIKAMERLIDELKDIASPLPLRPLTEIAEEIRQLAKQLQLEVDPLHKTLLSRRGVSPITTL